MIHYGAGRMFYWYTLPVGYSYFETTRTDMRLGLNPLIVLRIVTKFL